MVARIRWLIAIGVVGSLLSLWSSPALAQDDPQSGSRQPTCGYGSAALALGVTGTDLGAGDDGKGPPIAEAPKCETPHLRTLLLATAVLTLAVGEHSVESRLRGDALDWRFGAAELVIGGTQLALAGWLFRVDTYRTDAAVIAVSSLALGLVIDGAQRIIAGRETTWRVSGAIEPRAGGTLQLARSF